MPSLGCFHQCIEKQLATLKVKAYQTQPVISAEVAAVGCKQFLKFQLRWIVVLSYTKV